jgi:hypothetical protein
LEHAATAGALSTSGWGFDPAVPIALRFAVGDGLIEDVATGYLLTTAGERFSKSAVAAGLLSDEQQVLQKISKKITETMVNEVARRWEG